MNKLLKYHLQSDSGQEISNIFKQLYGFINTGICGHQFSWILWNIHFARIHKFIVSNGSTNKNCCHISFFDEHLISWICLTMKSTKIGTRWITMKLLYKYLLLSGVVPSKTPFGLHSVILVHYFSGAHYIRGGPSELAFQMIQVIEEKDGRVLVNAPVSEILMSEKGRAVGQSMESQCAFVILRFNFTVIWYLLFLFSYTSFCFCNQCATSSVWHFKNPYFLKKDNTKQLENNCFIGPFVSFLKVST